MITLEADKKHSVPFGAAFDLDESVPTRDGPTAGSRAENETDGGGSAKEDKRKHTAGGKQR